MYIPHRQLKHHGRRSLLNLRDLITIETQVHAVVSLKSMYMFGPKVLCAAPITGSAIAFDLPPHLKRYQGGHFVHGTFVLSNYFKVKITVFAMTCKTCVARLI
jgi:hypothetical protein